MFKSFKKISTFLFLTTTITYSQWIIQKPIISNISFNKIIALNQDNFIASSNNNLFKILTRIERCHDISPNIQVNEVFADFHFINEEMGWILYQKGQILQTIDGGKSWTCNSIGFAIEYHSIFFTNELVGFVVGYYGFLFKTTDGGKTWEQKQSNTTNRLRTIFFINNNIGWAAGNSGTVIRTTDGGENWLHMNIEQNFEIKKIRFLNLSFGWVIDESRVAITTDGGKTWMKKYEDSNSRIKSAWFNNSLHGIIITGGIIVTNNGGKNWDDKILPTIWGLRDLAMIDEQKGVAIGARGMICRTRDGGLNWETISQDQLFPISKIKFYDINIGYMALYTDILCRTTNGGLTWKGIFRNEIKDFYIVDKNIVLLLADLVLYMSQDGGSSWHTLFKMQNHIVKSFFVKENKIFIVAVKPGTQKVFFSNDLGISWAESILAFFEEPHSIFFIDKNIGWIGCAAGSLLKSIDGGNSWNKISSLPLNDIRFLLFIDPQNGWAWNYDSPFYKTSDGGITWSREHFINDEDINSIHFINNKKGWACGKNGKILETNDGGKSWKYIFIDTNLDLLSIYFVNSFIGWVGGRYGYIYKTNTGGEIFPNPNNPSFSTFYLYQNYPNPFNNETTILYQILKTSLVSIKIYDVLGNEIRNLINQVKPAGVHEINFNAANLSSGIYLYKIKAGDYTESKKMILLK